MQRAWKLQDAKARFSEVFELAASGKPQIVTRRGKDAVVVVARDEYDRLRGSGKSLVSFLLHSPLRGSGIDIPHTEERYIPRVDFSEDE